MSKTPTTELYFEAHITTDPYEMGEFARLEAGARRYGFRVADLLLDKTGTPSQADQFMTGRGQDYNELLARTVSLVAHLQLYGFVVRRYKLENTLLDVVIKKPA